jgi:hypothetical protein
MPNHVTNRLRIAVGTRKEFDEIKAFVRQGAQEEPDTPFTFECVAPMPAELRATITPSPIVKGLIAEPWKFKDTGYAHLVDLARTAKAITETERGYAGRFTLHPYTEEIPEPDAKKLEATENTLKAVIATGYIDWYSWALDHWGTKWDAYNVACNGFDSDGGCVLEYVFDTAWSAPTHITHKLSERFPYALFHHAWFDEGWNHAGDAKLVNGTETLGTPCDDWETQPNSVLYEYVYGEPCDYKAMRQQSVEDYAAEYEEDEEEEIHE